MEKKQVGWVRPAVAGAAAGLVNGFFGGGGGMIIVPVLLLLKKLPVKKFIEKKF